jgi:DNA polymerase I-like protein with 3'-5' exonuclease and polymerase domains
VCRDEAMLGLFRCSGDIYHTLASIIFDKPVQSVSKVERERAKTVCLGKLSLRSEIVSIISIGRGDLWNG